MKTLRWFKRLSIGNKIGVLSLVVGVIAAAATIGFGLFPAGGQPQKVLTQKVTANSESGSALSINEVSGSTLNFGTAQGVAAGSASEVDKQRIDGSSFSDASVLAFQTGGPGFGFASEVSGVWAERRVSYEFEETSETFRQALHKGHEIVHLSIGFDERTLWFDVKDTITTEQFRDMFVATGSTKLLILDGCGSFAVGKVLEEAGLDYLIVALPNSPTAPQFFDAVYRQLSRGVSPPDAVDRAKAEVRLKGGQASNFSITTY